MGLNEEKGINSLADGPNIGVHRDQEEEFIGMGKRVDKLCLSLTQNIETNELTIDLTETHRSFSHSSQRSEAKDLIFWCQDKVICQHS